ncbi:hypothetical protein EVAR_36860_1 [Eumeta japonica]|uniref:Uncharacterized protein n=1 Tax=Eumeta variegata TaxID=151549 RepID=A0A4C1WV41_EUMVA|nr:hypothetical protein EVAR_36860_1 [Eumeta japonica]
MLKCSQVRAAPHRASGAAGAGGAAGVLNAYIAYPAPTQRFKVCARTCTCVRVCVRDRVRVAPLITIERMNRSKRRLRPSEREGLSDQSTLGVVIALTATVVSNLQVALDQRRV